MERITKKRELLNRSAVLFAQGEHRYLFFVLVTMKRARSKIIDMSDKKPASWVIVN